MILIAINNFSLNQRHSGGILNRHHRTGLRAACIGAANLNDNANFFQLYATINN